jgi:mannose-6-phosphate isomerase-like protein (cupin superfamily)
MKKFAADETIAPSDDDRFRRMLVHEDRLRCAFLGYAAGDSVHLHAHLESDEIFFVVSGSATFEVGGENVEVSAGDLLHVGAGERHSILIPDEPLVLLAVVTPNRDDAWVPQG